MFNTNRKYLRTTIDSNIILRIDNDLEPQLLNPSLKGIYSDWKLLQNRCFGTLSNMFILIDEELITSHGIPISAFWNQFDAINLDNKNCEEMVKSILECMSLLVQKAPLYSFAPTSGQIQNYKSQYHLYPSVRVYIIMIFGVIGRFQGNIELNSVSIILLMLGYWRIFAV